MKRILVPVLMLVIGIGIVLPETPAFAQRYYKRSSYRRERSRSTWAPHRRPRRSWQDDRMGLYLGIGLLADMIARTDNELTQIINTGGGGDLFLGVRINQYFAIEVGGNMSIHGTDHDLVSYENAVLSGLTLDGKFYIIPSSLRLEPFLQVGGGFYNVQEEGFESTQLSGGGFHLGGGIELRLSRALTIGGRILYKGLQMDNSTNLHPATRSVYHNHATLEGNIQLHF